MKKNSILKYTLCVCMLLVGSLLANSQVEKWREQHKVKKNETLYSICQDYGIRLEELQTANPELMTSGYQPKKGDRLLIPYPKKKEETIAPQVNTPVTASPLKTKDDVRTRSIRVGVMLPLHDENGDGKRMVEYYRGILMACDSLKLLGISTDVYAWNLAEHGNVSTVLADPNAARCDVIFGPLYSKQMAELSAFVERNDIKLVIPFSIVAPELYTNRNIFQVYQSTNSQKETSNNRDDNVPEPNEDSVSKAAIQKEEVEDGGDRYMDKAVGSISTEEGETSYDDYDKALQNRKVADAVQKEDSDIAESQQQIADNNKGIGLCID
jgi:murein DD-endopeptidase MepM/ murein hydrolase activator NlpD